MIIGGGDNRYEWVAGCVEDEDFIGWVEPSLLYESPFTDFSPVGVEGVFEASEVNQLFALLDEVRSRAVAQL